MMQALKLNMAHAWSAPALQPIESLANYRHSRLSCAAVDKNGAARATNCLKETSAREVSTNSSNALRINQSVAFQLDLRNGSLKIVRVSAKDHTRKIGPRFCVMSAAGEVAGSSQPRSEVLKLVTVESGEGGRSSVGVVRGDKYWSLQDAFRLSDLGLSQIDDMVQVIRNWPHIVSRFEAESFEEGGTNLSDVKLLAPIPRPSGTIMCIGKNYLDHVKEVDTWKSAPGITTPDAPKHPIVFTKAPQSVIGPGAVIRYPQGVSSQVDYEAELAVIIGTGGQGIKKENAMEHVFGYTILNDVTARDLQKRHQQWFLGKSCDTFCPMGPWIVPATEIDGRDLQIQCWINEELRQNGRTSQMIFSIPELIEVLSAAITLQPGDIIATGTPAGVGSGFNPPRHLVPGDRIKIQIQGIGELNNTVV